MGPGITLLPFNLPGKIFRSVMPYGSYDPSGEIWPAYISEGITTVVVLAEEEEIIRISGRDLISLYQQQGWRVLHLPIEDYDVPEQETLRRTVADVLEAVTGGENLAVHCSAGLGRTGMFAACLAKKHFGITGVQAISWVRDVIPQAVETDAQRMIVMDF